MWLWFVLWVFPNMFCQRWPLYASMLAGAFPLFLTGMVKQWDVPAVKVMTDTNSRYYMSEGELTWSASISRILRICASIPFGLVPNIVGRKTSLILAILPFIVCWLVILFADTTAELTAGISMGLVASGLTQVAGVLYLSEVADDSRRAGAVFLAHIFMDAGKLFAVCSELYVDYDTVAWTFVAFPVALLLPVICVPESPYYYLMKKRYRDAEKALSMLRSSKEPGHNRRELAEMREFVEAKSSGYIKDLFNNPVNRRALTVCVGLNLIFVCSGISVLRHSLTVMFQLSRSNLSAEMCTVVVLAITLFTAVMMALGRIPDHLGRRTMLLSSLAGVSAALIGLGTFFYLHERTSLNLTEVRWLPLLLVLIFFVMQTWGLYSLKNVVPVELFSAEKKGFALSLVLATEIAGEIVVLNTYQNIVDAAGIFAALWTYAACGVVGFIFLYKFLPETSGKSFLHIQEDVHLCITGRS